MMQQRYAFLAQQLAFFGQAVVILDLEATGGNVVDDRITEIAFLRFDGDSVQQFSQLINPKREISEFIAGLTGIDDELVADAPSFAAVLPDILPLLRGAILMAHNSQFDYTLLRHECARAGVVLAMPTLCTVKLSKALYPNEYKHNLDSIALRFGLAVDDAARHRAGFDVAVLADFLQLAFQDNESQWKKCALNVLQPAVLPRDVPDWIRDRLAECADDYGVAMLRWGAETRFLLCRHGYREVVAWLMRHRYLWHEMNELRFWATMGELHNVQVYARCVREYGVALGEEIGRYTVVFYEQKGCLKAKIRPLLSGFYAQPPTGLFLHPKAGKRALVAWANESGICPTLLGILPYSVSESMPCPVSQVKPCSAACARQDVAAHNAQVLAQSGDLPTADWLNAPRLRVRECDEIRGVERDFVVERGALLLEDGSWFVHAEVLNVLKKKFKSARNSVCAL